MSIRTWKREFYSPISRCKKADALAHTLKKYLGTRKAAIARHSVQKTVDGDLTDGETVFYFVDKTCALCRFYHKNHTCTPECPLVTKSGKRCTNDGQPFSIWVETGDPEPLIRALRRAIKKQAVRRS